jgi:predicted nucleic acid-binding protein
MTRFFLDTNIFVYSFDRNSPVKAREATRLIRSALGTGKGVVSYQVVQEFMNVALRRFTAPMSFGEAREYFTTVLRPLFAVHSSQGLYMQALRLCEEHRLPWYDSLIVASAIEGQCELLYSEDLQHNRTFGALRIQNPFL